MAEYTIEVLRETVQVFNSIATAIEAHGIPVGSAEKSDYPGLIAQIDDSGVINQKNAQIETLTGQVSSLTTIKNSQDDALQAIRNAIIIKGGTVPSQDPSTYAPAIINLSTVSPSVFAAFQTQITQLASENTSLSNRNAALQAEIDDLREAGYESGSTIEELEQEISNMRIWFSDIYTELVAKHIPSGTVTEFVYSTYDNGVHVLPDYGATSQIESLEAQITQLQAQVQTLQNQVTSLTSANAALTTQVQTYEGYFSDIASSIQTMGGTVTDASNYASYDDYILTIPTGSSQISQLTGYLDDVYTAIVAMGYTQGTQGNYADYDTYVRAIPTYQSTVTQYESYFADIATAITNAGGTVTSATAYQDFDTYITTIPSGSATVALYESYFADIATAITAKGGTVTSATAYQDFDTYVASIPTGQTVASNFETYLAPQVQELNVYSDTTARVDNARDLFKNFTKLAYVYTKLNLRYCTDCTNMFGNLKNMYEIPTITNFGNDAACDLTIDLSGLWDGGMIELTNFANNVASYSGSYQRTIIVSHNTYIDSDNASAIKKLRNTRHFTVVDASTL